jgi:hypothetical protein
MIPQINIPPYDGVNFSVVQGSVISFDKRSNTYVSGGENNTAVSSRVVVTTEFWLRLLDGTEKHYKFQRDIPMKEEHQITMVSGSNGKETWTLYLYNHTASMRYWINDYYSAWWATDMNCGCFLWLPLFGSIFLIITYGYFAIKEPWAMKSGFVPTAFACGLFLILSSLLTFRFFKRKENARANQAITKHIDSFLGWNS